MIKAAHSIYFSATKNSKTYANWVAEGTGLTITEHDLTGPRWDEGELGFGPDELAVFSAPVYGGRIPALAVERFSRCKGNGTPAIVITTYGNRDYDDALLELADLAVKQGFLLAGAAAPIGRHSLLAHIAAGRPDNHDRAEAEAFGRKCFEKLAKNGATGLPELAIKGNRPYKESGKAPWRPIGTDACTNCQSCVKLCPVAAIPAENPKTTEEHCFNCGRCLVVCPVGARQIPEPVFKMLRERIDPLASGRKQSAWIL